jgi:hypothetical protein
MTSFSLFFYKRNDDIDLFADEGKEVATNDITKSYIIEDENGDVIEDEDDDEFFSLQGLDEDFDDEI